MIRLKSRQSPGPNGWLYTEKRTGWKSWEVDPVSQWDFNLLCRRYQEHAQANPGLRLETDLGRIQEMVDFANAMRYLQIAGADIYVNRSADPPKAVAPQPPPPPSRLAAVGQHIKNLDAGRKTLSEWWGEGGKPVEQELANKRAEICFTCPKNVTGGGLLARFTREGAALIQATIEEKNRAKLSTPFDEKLNVCEACDCPLVLKCFVPLKHITSHLPEASKSKLHPDCWILSEQKFSSTRLLRSVWGGPTPGISFYCPGCNQAHVIELGEKKWKLSGTDEKPTIEPSVLATGTNTRCHVVIVDGVLNFQSDCNHSLANQQVPMCEFPKTHG